MESLDDQIPPPFPVEENGLRHRTGDGSSPCQDTEPNGTACITQEDEKKMEVKVKSKFESVFGFDWNNCTSKQRFIRLMNRPMDPACLGIFRVMFGVLMFLDLYKERGFQNAHLTWADPDTCRFPLFNSLSPMAVEWMVVLYSLMAIGTIGILFGFMYRASTLLLAIPYWYIFLLEKTKWNNHSYMFGLVSIMHVFSDANRYWSIDGLIRPEIRNAHVPLWQYLHPRFQVFILYFLAGLKKFPPDWVQGYSMTGIAKSWVFWPFRLVLSESLVNVVVVHWGGLFIDLTLGFWLFFDKTRPYGIVLGLLFNTMNSQLFGIGMFPYTNMCTIWLFCYVDWPRRLFRRLPNKKWLTAILPLDTPPQPSIHCLYDKEEVKAEDMPEPDDQLSKTKLAKSSTPSMYHKVLTVMIVSYISIQLFLPYSHFITKGYNSWTEGTYGYSWNMMVHNTRTAHSHIRYVDKDTGNEGYLQFPWVQNQRWMRIAHQTDTIKQYIDCISKRVVKYNEFTNISNVEIYMDQWSAMNHRVLQRTMDPRVDIAAASWTPFTDTSWWFPVMEELEEWRDRLYDIRIRELNGTNATKIEFFADMPGMYVRQYLSEHQNGTLHVLHGTVVLQYADELNISLGVNESASLKPGEFSNIHTVSQTPSLWSYKVTNFTHIEFLKNLTEYETLLNETTPAGQEWNLTVADDDDNLTKQYKQMLTWKNNTKSMPPQPWPHQQFWMFLNHLYYGIKMSFWTTVAAWKAIFTVTPLRKAPILNSSHFKHFWMDEKIACDLFMVKR